MISFVKNYFESVREAYQLGNIESSYYAPIIELFTTMGCTARDLSGERSSEAGQNIDIKLWHSVVEATETEPFAGVEVKKINGIDERAKKQIKSEARRYGYAILTDNLVWQFWRADEDQMYAGVRLIDFRNGSLVLIDENVELFVSLISDFMLIEPMQIRSSNRLAEYMAMHSRTIRSVITGILKDDGTGHPLLNAKQRSLPMFPELYGLYSRIKNDLVPEMTTRDFADMYAQTVVYGLFIARYNDTTSDSFDRFEAIQYLQEESALLKQFFMHIASSGRRHPTLDSVIDKLCALYRICDISGLLEHEDNQDTIIHFYETFLTFYDPALRKSLGVFYTPVQAVRYLVKAVDRILVEDFNIVGGLSNNDYLTKNVQSEPYKVSKTKFSTTQEIQVPRVAILDPACGTGSFGAEIIKYIKKTYFSGAKEAFYQHFIHDKKGLMSRLIGFEIMMTSYVVAHLKIRRTIDETLGFQSDVLLPTNIFLTNTLARPHSELERNEQIGLFDFSAAISDEAYHADTWKTRRPIKVIIGNPPYFAASKNPYDISSYKTETDGVTEFNERKHWLNDDYVKFFRFAEELIHANQEGILAFVSNNGFLDNPTFRGMRASLLRTFDKIYILNLHGSANKKEVAPDGSKDENIFNIMQGVSLFIGVKQTQNSHWGKLHYSDLWGTRASKFLALDMNTPQFAEISVDPQMAYFIPFDTEDRANYMKGISITELFPEYVTGIISGNDEAAIAPSRGELQRRIDTVKSATDEKPIVNIWKKFSRGQTAERIQDDVNLSDGMITKIAFRPFDYRWTFYSGNSCSWILWPREKTTMGHLLQTTPSPIGENLGLVFCKTSRSFFPPFIAKHIISHRLFSALAEITYVAPLYLFTSSTLGGDKWIANIGNAAYDELTKNLEEKPSPIELLDYTYGVLHDPIYCERFAEYLHRDFPRIPKINDIDDADNPDAFFVSVEMYRKYVAIGGDLRKLHLMENVIQSDLSIEPNSPDDMVISSVKFVRGVLHLNNNKRIHGITEEVWKYTIGGYQVIERWVKSHIGDQFTVEYFNQLATIVSIINKTIDAIDQIKEMHIVD